MHPPTSLQLHPPPTLRQSGRGPLWPMPRQRLPPPPLPPPSSLPSKRALPPPPLAPAPQSSGWRCLFDNCAPLPVSCLIPEISARHSPRGARTLALFASRFAARGSSARGLNRLLHRKVDRIPTAPPSQGGACRCSSPPTLAAGAGDSLSVCSHGAVCDEGVIRKSGSFNMLTRMFRESRRQYSSRRSRTPVKDKFII